MKILLVGEYSRLHNSLKEGLQALGHEVKILGDGDAFKGFPVDYTVKPLINSFWLSRKIKVGIYKLTGIDLAAKETALRFLRFKTKLKGYDVVQLINSAPLKADLEFQRKQIKFLKQHNKHLFLLVCGNDYPVINFLLENSIKNHVLTPYFNGDYPEKEFKFILNYASPAFKKYYKEVEPFFEKLIPSDIDYVLPLENHPKAAPLIPNPINIDSLKLPQNLDEIDFETEQIHIFHGINKSSSSRKGNRFFEEALVKIAKRFPERVKITTVSSLPYKEYIKIYDTAHIVLDQVYAYDQGYNALEAMAKGKVVFTGAEAEFLKHYNLQEDQVCINALPDVDFLVEKLSWLIDNPKEIKKIGKNAREFIQKEHHYIEVAKKYLATWQN